VPKQKKPYENVGIQRQLYEETREFVGKSGRYRSVSEFVHEAVRLRLEQLIRELKEPKAA
jgi:Arc/MetJ-type ribon-helix-helix transcriptional regulator